MGTGELSGEGVVLVGPLGDQGPQGRVGGEDPVVAVAMDARRGENLGQAIQELEGRKAQRGATGQVGPREEVEDLVGATVDEVETVEGERRPGTIADEAFEARAIGGLDADTPIQTEPAAVLPGEHVLGLVGLQEAVAAKVPEDPGADGVLEVLQELGGEAGGLVEAEAGFWILAPITRGLLEEAIDHTEMKMEVRIEAGAEAVEEAHGTEGGGGWSGGTGLPEGGSESPEEDMQDGAGGPGPVVEEGSEAFGHGEHELADRDVGEDVVRQVGRGLGHAFGVA
jgi:hypothetical protein